MVKVTIDQDACIACGICYNTCGEVFDQDSEGFSILVEEYRTSGETEGEVPDDIGCTSDAAENCPVDAIELS